MRSKKVALLLITVATGLLAACETVPQGARATRADASVNPGINAKYRETSDPAHWTARFETHGRECFDRRGDILRAIGLRSGQDVADIGAGTGLFTIDLARAVGGSGRVFAVDIIPEFVEHVAARARSEGLANVEPVHCRDDSAELPEASIDVAFICDTYHHFEYPMRTMRSIWSALRPGGEVVLIDFFRIEGRSRPFIMKHVRAGEGVVIQEVMSAGFELVERRHFMTENYFLRFRKVERTPPTHYRREFEAPSRRRATAPAPAKPPRRSLIG